MTDAAYLRAIRGPVLLTVLGVLILIDHRTEYSFWTIWPLLLVTGGLMVLAERMAVRENPWAAAAPQPQPAAPPPPAAGMYRPFGQFDPETGARREEPRHEGGPQV
ncbi:MAG: hypothetical protein FJW31_26955 [Acidobacteria bacterium]|nr:hypothetical protein [Acidobacteriota bacterium]